MDYSSEQENGEVARRRTSRRASADDSAYSAANDFAQGGDVRYGSASRDSASPVASTRAVPPVRSAVGRNAASHGSASAQGSASRMGAGRSAGGNAGGRSAGAGGGAGSGYGSNDYGLRPAPDLTKSEEIIRVRKKRKKASKGKKAVLITLIALLCLVGVVGGAAALYLNSLSKAISFDDEEAENNLRDVLAETTTETANKPYYVLLLGSDAREEDEASRSDTMILMRVDQEAGQLTMVSIPRDTMVDLPGYGRSKINAAYAYNGAAGAVEAVNDFAGVSISHYVEIHFEELEELVDALGGVWVDIPVSNDQTGSSNTGVTLNAGEQLLNGEEALAFARERYGYLRGDFQRADNQKILVQAIIEQVLDVSPLSLPGTIQQLAECVTTDYSLTDIISLAQEFQSAGDITFYSATVPSSTMTIDGVSYVICDQTEWTEMMQLVDAGYDPNAETVATGEDTQETTETTTDTDDSESEDADAG